MSLPFAYISLLDTFGPALVAAESQCLAKWSNPSNLATFLARLDRIDFSDYDQRKIGLFAISALKIPQFFYTYSFDPLQYPLNPPRTQTRFPGFGTYVYIDSPEFQTQINVIEQTLSYRDSDGPIAVPLAAFSAALFQLHSLYSTRTSFFDQAAWEVTAALIWSIYPVPIPPPFSPLKPAV